MLKTFSRKTFWKNPEWNLFISNIFLPHFFSFAFLLSRISSLSHFFSLVFLFSSNLDLLDYSDWIHNFVTAFGDIRVKARSEWDGGIKARSEWDGGIKARSEWDGGERKVKVLTKLDQISESECQCECQSWVNLSEDKKDRRPWGIHVIAIECHCPLSWSQKWSSDLLIQLWRPESINISNHR